MAENLSVFRKDLEAMEGPTTIRWPEALNLRSMNGPVHQLMETGEGVVRKEAIQLCGLVVKGQLEDG
jgi:hypothetical protein